MSTITKEVTIDEAPRSNKQIPQSGDYTIFWTREQLMDYIEMRRNMTPKEPKIRRQKPKPPRRPYNDD